MEKTYVTGLDAYILFIINAKDIGSTEIEAF